jgi:hypothetical protein
MHVRAHGEDHPLTLTHTHKHTQTHTHTQRSKIQSILCAGWRVRPHARPCPQGTQRFAVCAKAMHVRTRTWAGRCRQTWAALVYLLHTCKTRTGTQHRAHIHTTHTNNTCSMPYVAFMTSHTVPSACARLPSSSGPPKPSFSACNVILLKTERWILIGPLASLSSDHQVHILRQAHFPPSSFQRAAQREITSQSQSVKVVKAFCHL